MFTKDGDFTDDPFSYFDEEGELKWDVEEFLEDNLSNYSSCSAAAFLYYLQKISTVTNETALELYVKCMR